MALRDITRAAAAFRGALNYLEPFERLVNAGASIEQIAPEARRALLAVRQFATVDDFGIVPDNFRFVEANRELGHSRRFVAGVFGLVRGIHDRRSLFEATDPALFAESGERDARLLLEPAAQWFRRQPPDPPHPSQAVPEWARLFALKPARGKFITFTVGENGRSTLRVSLPKPSEGLALRISFQGGRFWLANKDGSDTPLNYGDELRSGLFRYRFYPASGTPDAELVRPALEAADSLDDIRTALGPSGDASRFNDFLSGRSSYEALQFSPALAEATERVMRRIETAVNGPSILSAPTGRYAYPVPVLLRRLRYLIDTFVPPLPADYPLADRLRILDGYWDLVSRHSVDRTGDLSLLAQALRRTAIRGGDRFAEAIEAGLQQRGAIPLEELPRDFGLRKKVMTLARAEGIPVTEPRSLDFAEEDALKKLGVSPDDFRFEKWQSAWPYPAVAKHLAAFKSPSAPADVQLTLENLRAIGAILSETSFNAHFPSEKQGQVVLSLKDGFAEANVRQAFPAFDLEWIARGVGAGSVVINFDPAQEAQLHGALMTFHRQHTADFKPGEFAFAAPVLGATGVSMEGVSFVQRPVIASLSFGELRAGAVRRALGVAEVKIKRGEKVIWTDFERLVCWFFEAAGIDREVPAFNDEGRQDFPHFARHTTA